MWKVARVDWIEDAQQNLRTVLPFYFPTQEQAEAWVSKAETMETYKDSQLEVIPDTSGPPSLGLSDEPTPPPLQQIQDS